MQNAAFRARGLDATYVALRVTPDAIAAVMRTLAANGGGGNVTIPFKREAAAAGAVRSERVLRLGVANLFGADGTGALLVDNSDVDGVLAVVAELAPAATDWLVSGTGGSARAVAGAAREVGARLVARSRVPARAAAFGEWAATIGVGATEPAACQLVINATPLGLHAGDALPIAPDELRSATAAFDLTYRADGTTEWITACRSRGLATADGRDMLLAQGAASWRVWFPGIDPPRDVMRTALDGRLG